MPSGEDSLQLQQCCVKITEGPLCRDLDSMDRSGALAQDDTQIREQTMKSTQQYLQLMREQRWEEWSDLWADDAVLEFPFAPAGHKGTYYGRQEIREYMAGTTGRIRVDGVTGLTMYPMLNPEALLVELSIKGTMLANDADYPQRYVTLFQFKNGKIQHYKEYWNPAVTMKAMGATYEEWAANYPTDTTS